MRMGRLTGAACAALLATSAHAQTAHRGKPNKATLPDFSSWMSGGAVSCFDPHETTAQQQEILLRMGQQACATQPAPPVPQPRAASARAVAYRADGYTVYREGPGYCALFLDTPRGAMLRLSYRADGVTSFFYVRAGLALDPATPSYPALFQFDGSPDPMTYSATDAQLADGRAGFMLANAGSELLDAWGGGTAVAIRLGGVDARPFDTIELTGAGAAITALRRCAQPGFADVITPTVMPAPSGDPTALLRAYIVGVWADTPRACVGDSYVQYAPDGTWIEGGNAGSWALAGDRLTVTTTETTELGDPTPPRTLDPPTSVTWTVRRLGKNRLAFSGPAGGFTVVKCP